MPAIDFLKDWELKKHGWPALLVLVLWIGYETFAPKDPSCTNQVEYLQKQNTTLVNNQIELNKQLLFYRQRDSAYKKVISPYKTILKKR